MAAWKKASQPVQPPISEKKDKNDAVSKINHLIHEEYGKMAKCHQQLGEKYAQLHSSDYEEDFAELIQSLDASRRKLDNYSMQMQFITGVIICTNCGHKAPKGSIFCNMCGRKLPEFHFENYEMCEACCSLVDKGIDVCPNCNHPMRPENENLIKCHKCGESVGKENRFCPICGEPLFPDSSNSGDNTSPKGKRCPKCNAMMSPDKLFCTECGTKVN